MTSRLLIRKEVVVIEAHQISECGRNCVPARDSKESTRLALNQGRGGLSLLKSSFCRLGMVDAMRPLPLGSYFTSELYG